MKYIIKDRKGKEFVIKETYIVRFLYNSCFGRFFIKFLSFPFFSKSVGRFLDLSLSKIFIKRFIVKNKINMDLYEQKCYVSFNDFFTRHKKKELIKINYDPHVLISPCDAKLICYDIDLDSKYKIKDSLYSISNLLKDAQLSDLYKDGYMLVFRLCADDYHRYVYIDDGFKEKNNFIKGVFHTVRPIALSNYDVFKENSREYTVLHTENFGDVVQIEVGALLVGKISNLHDNYNFKRGEEKGFFEFGGSTIILLFKKDCLVIDKDILENSKNGIETLVNIGEVIGKKS